MVVNTRLAFRIFIIILIIAFALILLLIFGFRDDGSALDNALGALGFESADASGSESEPAVPLPSEGSGATGSSGPGGGSGGAGAGSAGSTGNTGSSGSGSNPAVLPFCTFDRDHIVEGAVPCRCGLSAVCIEIGQRCDATFNNGNGVCE